MIEADSDSVAGADLSRYSWHSKLLEEIRKPSGDSRA